MGSERDEIQMCNKKKYASFCLLDWSFAVRRCRDLSRKGGDDRKEGLFDFELEVTWVGRK